MTRAHRHFTPGHVWHITHRCHERSFLLRFARDRKRWLHWLHEARSRYGLCVLNYIVTRNHVHLLVKDRGRGEIARSVALAAGRTAWEYNRRKGRLGAFWQDRYHATAVDTESHLHRCIGYIDMNMVRAGAVSHPLQWRESGCVELQRQRKRHRIIDVPALLELTGHTCTRTLRSKLLEQVERSVRSDALTRQPEWTEPLAIGSQRFVEGIRTSIGGPARYRSIVDCTHGGSVLRDKAPARYNAIWKAKIAW